MEFYFINVGASSANYSDPRFLTPIVDAFSPTLNVPTPVYLSKDSLGILVKSTGLLPGVTLWPNVVPKGMYKINFFLINKPQ